MVQTFLGRLRTSMGQDDLDMAGLGAGAACAACGVEVVRADAAARVERSLPQFVFVSSSLP
ncbi:hypothetical protein CKO42_11340 [Lamprobacter modestohalophilus]|uniref:Uncharacterized protein n=1 Tax=Lamprobacter modestohalophilus TaxID=1064514 RepID=A0A9X0W8S1_9GAMM|nr:hypothetical protein [Lamprobacter modestohalophilus]